LGFAYFKLTLRLGLFVTSVSPHGPTEETTILCGAGVLGTLKTNGDFDPEDTCTAGFPARFK
jgi:hypothetical protein